MSRQTLNGSPASTHAVAFDNYRCGRKSVAECGELVDERDIAADGANPTCPECLAELAKTAEDVFGAPTGTPVRSTWGNPLAGYSPKGSR